MIYVLAFVASGVVVVIAATALARYGDAIAQRTKLGRVWIGAVLLAGATSLPELATDIAAVRMGAPDIAAGDLFGSSMANMLILAFIDLMPPRRHLLQRVSVDHALAASLAISMNAIAAMLVLLRPTPVLLWVGPGSVLLLLVYVAGMRVVYRHTTREGAELPVATSTGGGARRAEGTVEDTQTMTLRRAIVGFAIAALVVLVASPVFAWSAKGIAALTGLGNTFVGTWLVGLATSLPELVSCIAAVRMGSFDLAVGNLFGSNALNMAVFFAVDLAEPASLFAILGPGHAISAMSAVLLMSLGLAAIIYRGKRRFAMLEPDSAIMVVVYGISLWLVYDRSVG